MLKWERKLDVLELEFGIWNPPDPGSKGEENILGSESRD